MKEGTLAFTIQPEGAPASAHAKVSVQLESNGKEGKGKFHQGKRTFAIFLTQVDSVNALPGHWKRPQTPKAPFPYSQRDVHYINPSDRSTIAGTLTFPKGEGPFPAALLITGSGAQDRDETIFGHKPFLLIADALTREGFAVLRVDDRGVGKSTGDMKSATVFNFATDVNTGLDFLSKQPEIDPKRLGLIGHSEGGLVAAIVGAKRKGLAFIISLAGVGIPMDTMVIQQVRTVTRNEKSLTPEAAALVVKAQQDAIAAVKRNANTDEVKTILHTLYQTLRRKKLESKALRVLSEKELEAKATMEAGILLSPGLSTAFKTIPARYWKDVRCPILALNGSKDFQVTPKENLEAIKTATSKNRDVTTTELPGLNHLFQKADTGLLDEYATIEETMNPVVLTTLITWLKARTHKK